MLFGLNQNKETAVPPETKAGAPIFDVTLADFEEKVIKASMDKPVLVDFWAPWCGPCKQLMPLLEAEVVEAGGAVLLAKVDIDQNPELAQAMQVQSVPTVLAFFQGQPVTGFQGVQPQSQLKALISQLAKMGTGAKEQALDMATLIDSGAVALAAGDVMQAQNAYGQALQAEPENTQAYAGMIRVFIAAGQIDQAQALFDNAPETVKNSADLQAVKAALELAAKGGDVAALEKKLSASPEDHQLAIDLAQAQFVAGMKEEAINTLLASIAKDREWSEAAARKALIQIFDALGGADPLTVQGRKKLSRLLFS